MNLFRRPFVSDGKTNTVQCPFGWCEAVPHIMGTILSRGPDGPIPSSTSGPGLIIEYCCESCHHWQVIFEDHSGGTWISIKQLPDVPEPEL